MQRSVVPLVAGIWLVVGGILLAVGNFTLAHRIFNLLVPLTLIAMGIWAIVRAGRLHRMEQSLPSKVTLSEIAFAVALLFVYGLINGVLRVPSLTARPTIAPEPMPIASNLTTPIEELPKQPKWVMVQQLTTLPVQLDIVGGENFAVIAGKKHVRAFAPNSETVRVELVGVQNLQPPLPRVTQLLQISPVRLKVPKTAILEVNGSNFAYLLVRDMEGDVQVSYGGANPIVTISTKGNITVRQVNYPQQPMIHSYRPQVDELTVFPGPNSRVTIRVLSDTIRIFAQQPPQEEWQVRAESGAIEVRLPSNSSVKFSATCIYGHGSIQIPFGQTRMVQRNHNRRIEHEGTLGNGKVPINLSVGTGNITVVLTQ
ncbi:MAG: DUF4097 family beta strand repeat-containing protein [Armatimonadetes bacterium]|nr:DUF4097 family beta strand repeat-containing protein [Armatimonadota bacterium]MDW8027127.1 DUF4097 family beta strand repeat-containing protein [Armatimonadota bacterium]